MHATIVPHEHLAEVSSAPLSTADKRRLDHIAEVAAYHFDAPLASVVINEGDELWLAGVSGMKSERVKRDGTFCAYCADDTSSFFEVENALADDRFRDHPLVTGPQQVRYYAGVPLRTGNALLGTLCVLDTKPRKLDAKSRRLLIDLSEFALQGELAASLLRASEARYGSVFENAAVGMAQIDKNGHWIRINNRLLEIMGFVRGEVMASTIFDMILDADVETARARLDQLWRGGLQSYKLETQLRQRGGDYVWVDIALSVQSVDDGASTSALVVVQDIELRKAAEERQRLLIAEINHRVKNTLATVQSIARQTVRRLKKPEDFVVSFLDRLQALSSAHDLLTQTSWAGANLAKLVETELSHLGLGTTRVTIVGPDVLLPPPVALNMSLVLHELTANAVQHGALATAHGTIAIKWRLDAGGPIPRLVFEWTEAGSDPAPPPTYAGFGMLLLRRGLEQGLGAQTTLRWEDTGLAVMISIPMPDSLRRTDLFRP